MGDVIGALLPDVGAWIAGAVVAAFGVLLAWAKLASGRADRATRRADEAEAHIETRERIDDAVEASRASGGSWHDRLRAHSDRKP
jgi:uncharacterized membrane protein YccC